MINMPQQQMFRLSTETKGPNKAATRVKYGSLVNMFFGQGVSPCCFGKATRLFVQRRFFYFFEAVGGTGGGGTCTEDSTPMLP